LFMISMVFSWGYTCIYLILINMPHWHNRQHIVISQKGRWGVFKRRQLWISLLWF
jgi:hypothetical protein